MFRSLPTVRYAQARRGIRIQPNLIFPADSIRANNYVTCGSTIRHSETEQANGKAANGDSPIVTLSGSVAQEEQAGEENGCATTGRLVTLRTFLVHALKLQSPIVQLDLKDAFHHLSSQEESQERPGELPPIEQSSKTGLVGLKSTPSGRCNALAKSLEDHQLRRSISDPCLFVGDQFHVFFLTDSILIIGNIEIFKSKFLTPRFSSRPNLREVDTILGIQIRSRSDQESLHLSQPALISKALAELKICDDEGEQVVPTPLTPKLHLVEASDEEHEKFLEKGYNYRKSVSLLEHIASNTRPDISYASSSLSQFMDKPGIQHWTELERCWKYLKATKDMGLEYKINTTEFDLEVWSDADWANDPVTRKSQSGYLACLYGSCISWNSARQVTVSLSSTESEIRALVEATQELIWLQNLISELNTLPSPNNTNRSITHMNYIDNNALGCILANSSFQSKTKHIDVHTKWLREHVQSNTLSYQWIPTKSMLADCLTKPAPKSSYNLLCSKISLL
ncbi:hypothetical protein Pst134EA_033560 [Puccinia striiformis f. sp. tritici]|uniref:uncharacterized protein n=1 Tax=Puccinia striiformis f. sp. tritici TaxID=168172 RepID=UPI002008700A|nr:uncharacterized protein Pst134EA_033560 [Puccinia striiformis f. sp. tritici]KAH9441577.1 hypothetical protein Pst134EA_033560 [Puccinia striiformis f. sp. tritici]